MSESQSGTRAPQLEVSRRALATIAKVRQAPSELELGGTMQEQGTNAVQNDTQDASSLNHQGATATAEQSQTETTEAGEQSVDAQVPPSYQPAGFDALDRGSDNPSTGDANLELILDIPVNIALEIGRTQISIRNLMQLNQGSVVELDRLAGEPLDVLVNGTLIAHGEVVMVNEKFGIRLTDVVSPAERVRNLK